ncbi:ornithine cyclodeaminase family protein [Bacteroidota bacterium]
MLCLSESDIIKAVTLTELVDAIESAFIIYEKGDFFMPPRMHIDYKKNTLLLMPCFTEDKFATKLVSLFPDNPAINKPVLYGSVLLNDGETGEPLAIINGAKLTAMRTGAVGGVAVRWLSDNNSETLGIIGAGVQGFHQALFCLNERNIKTLNVFDKNEKVIQGFINKIPEYKKNIKICRCKSSEEVLDNSEIIIMATTSTKPVLTEKSEKLKDKTYVAIGSYKPEMKEFPAALFHLADQYFIDTEHAMEESGDLIDPLNNNWFNKEKIYTAGKLLSGEIKLSENKTRIFKSVGMALFDLVVADLIYKKAIEKGIGTSVEI